MTTRHGTSTAYRAGCRCELCTAHMRDYARRYRRRKILGQTIWVDRAIVLRHVERLKASGMSWRDIATVGGYDSGTIVRMLITHDSPRMHADSARRILAIQPQQLVNSHAHVPALGTIRRLRALARIGWDLQSISQATGISRLALLKIRAEYQDSVTAATRLAVREFYENRAGLRGPSEGAARYAARQNWFPPAAWDDDTIETATNTSAWRNTRRKGWEVDLWT